MEPVEDEERVASRAPEDGRVHRRSLQRRGMRRAARLARRVHPDRRPGRGRGARWRALRRRPVPCRRLRRLLGRLARAPPHAARTRQDVAARADRRARGRRARGRRQAHRLGPWRPRPGDHVACAAGDRRRGRSRGRGRDARRQGHGGVRGDRLRRHGGHRARRRPASDRTRAGQGRASRRGASEADARSRRTNFRHRCRQGRREGQRARIGSRARQGCRAREGCREARRFEPSRPRRRAAALATTCRRPIRASSTPPPPPPSGRRCQPDLLCRERARAGDVAACCRRPGELVCIRTARPEISGADGPHRP